MVAHEGIFVKGDEKFREKTEIGEPSKILPMDNPDKNRP